MAEKGTELARAESGQGAAQQAMALVTRGREAFAAMPAAKRTRLILLMSLLLAAGAAVAWWANRTDWKTLYSGLEQRDLEQVEGELAAASISYQATADGTGVQVPVEMVDKARMVIAEKGMPQSGRMGFELFDKPNWVGSEFDEQVNYQRALEGELEHTIATIGAVRSARVHLVLAKESLFSSQQQPAKASVVLKLKTATLGREQVASIRNLVAGAVQGLAAEQVTLVDADGKVNFDAPGRAEESVNAERALETKLVEMLEPLAGRDNVRASVNIAYDDGTEERTDEVVDPSQVVALTSEKRDQSSGVAPKAAGIPGTASNTPASPGANQPANAPAMPVYPTANAQNQTTHEESATFAVSKHTTHEEQGPRRIVRVTAAVLVNDRAVNEGSGKDARKGWKPRSAEEMKRLEQLAQAAVGFDAKRGDQVVLENISFEGNVPEVPLAGFAKFEDEAKSLLRQQPELLKTLGGALATVLLILLVIRPLAMQTLSLLKEKPSVEMEAAAPELAAGDVSLSLSSGVSADATNATGAREEQLPAPRTVDAISAHILRDPREGSRVLESWISGSEVA